MSCRSASAYRLRQHHLCPELPERHLHSAVQVESDRQCSLCLLWPAQLDIQHAQAEVAVRLQRAHANLFGQGEGLAVVGFGLGNVRWIAMRGTVAQETVRMRLVAMPCVGAGEIEEAFGKGARLVHAVNEEQSLTQLGEHNSILEYAAPGGKAFQHLVQEWECLCNTPGKGIRCPQDRGGQGQE